MFRVLVLGVFVGCTSNTTPSPVRGNVVEILRGGTWTDDRCTEQRAEFCCRERGLVDCTNFDRLSVVSVRSQGDRVAALILSNGTSLTLARSSDRGATWKVQSIDDDDFSRGGQAYRGGMDIFLNGDDVRIYIPRLELGALGREYSRGYLYRVDPTTGKLSYETQTMPGAHMVEVRDGRAIFLVPDRDPRGGPQSVMAAEVDPTDRSNDRSALPTCEVPACDSLSAGAFQGTDDGDTYLGFANASRGSSAECLIAYSRSRQALGYRCVPFSEWPAAVATEFAVFSYVDHQAPVLRLFNAHGHAWAVTILDGVGSMTPQPSAPADLGPGRFFTNGSFSGRPRHRGLAIVVPDPTGPARLVRLHESGLAQDVLLPPSPCEDHQRCGDRAASLQQVYGQVAWSEPLGDDEYLVFYLNDADAALNSHTPVLSVAREKASYRDLDPGAGFPTSAGPLGYPGAQPTGALERLCVRQASCIGGQGGFQETINTCISQWTVRRTMGAAEHQAALAAFLATPPGCSFFTCGSCVGGRCVDAGVCAFPPEAVAGCNSCTPEGKAITCTITNRVTQVLDCAAVGQSCFCTRDEDGGCGLAPACIPAECTRTEAQCDGDVWSTCDERRDCSLRQLSCSVNRPDPTREIGCQDPGPIPATAACVATSAVCDGKYLLTCADGRMRWTDCVELGFARCGLVEGTNAFRCQP
ncbi:MAG: hypothetical protein Q8K32_30935 [Archangium sp.]|nr:hypothetical protein [Archangium sp.]